MEDILLGKVLWARIGKNIVENIDMKELEEARRKRIYCFVYNLIKYFLIIKMNEFRNGELN